MTWDYIIVGAGSAGCAVAHELAEAGKTVLIIEAGGEDRSPFIKVAAGQVRACADHDWGYRSQPDPTRGGASESWIRGRVLGGSSSINGTMYTRGVPADFDRWNIPGWSWRDVLPVFRKFERSDQPGPLRGQKGQLHIRTVRHPHAVTDAFIASARAVGMPFNPDYNADSQDGVGYAQLTQRGRFRCSAADAFLKPVLGKRNFKLMLNSMVERVEIENGRAVAVCFTQGGKGRRETGRDIVVCAGAINSPKLLLLSGIGDAEQLRRHGVQMQLDLPGVGRNLKDQPMVSLLYRSNIPTYNPTEGWYQKLAIAASFLSNGEGPISNLFEGAAFVKSSPTEITADLQVIFLAFGYGKGANGEFALTPYPAMMALIMASYPRSSGWVSLASDDAKDPPLIECRLLQAQADVDALVGGIGEVRKIMSTEPIASLVVEEVMPGRVVESASAVSEHVRAHAGISYHPIGTCRMGFGPEAVVGPDLRVHGTENLWVADASIIPDHLSANLNAVCMLVGTKLGQQLAARG